MKEESKAQKIVNFFILFLVLGVLSVALAGCPGRRRDEKTQAAHGAAKVTYNEATVNAWASNVKDGMIAWQNENRAAFNERSFYADCVTYGGVTDVTMAAERVGMDVIYDPTKQMVMIAPSAAYIGESHPFAIVLVIDELVSEECVCSEYCIVLDVGDGIAEDSPYAGYEYYLTASDIDITAFATSSLFDKHCKLLFWMPDEIRDALPIIIGNFLEADPETICMEVADEGLPQPTMIMDDLQVVPVDAI